jgi:hypothetical protein
MAILKFRVYMQEDESVYRDICDPSFTKIHRSARSDIKGL